MKRIAAILLAAAAALLPRAQEIETVETIDGNAYAGYISGQLPGGAVVVQCAADSSAVTLHLADIALVNRVPYPADRLNGLCDVVTLENGIVIKGQITKTVPGRQITIVDEAGVAYEAPMDDVVLQQRVPVSPDMPLMEQTPLIETFDFGDFLVEGLMVSQNMRTGELQIATLLGDTVTQSNLELMMLTRRPNDAFQQKIAEKKPEKKKPYQGLTANGKRLAKAKRAVNFVINKNIALQNDGKFAVVPPKDGKLRLEMPAGKAANYMLYPLDYAKYFNSKRDISVKYDELRSRAVPRLSSQNEDDGMMSITYSVNSGLYLVYESASGSAYVFMIR